MSRYLMLLGIGVILSACAYQGGAPAPDPGGTSLRSDNPCASGTGSTDRNAPIVCVDDRGGTLSVTPDPIRVNGRGEADRLPVMIHWYTRSGTNDLQIEVEPGCVTEVRCARPGHCSARSVPRDDKSEKRCKYDVWTDKHPRLDPEIIIDPCC